jgi:hypothetical protein
MTEKNSVMVKEATNSSETMSTQARNFSQLVSYLTIGKEQDSRAAA